MTSIMTNTAAMAALQTLRSINSDMEMTQNRVSPPVTGFRPQPTTRPTGRSQPPCVRTTRHCRPFRTRSALAQPSLMWLTPYEFGHRRGFRNQGQAGCRPRAGCRQDQDRQGTDRTQEPAGFDLRIRFVLR